MGVVGLDEGAAAGVSKSSASLHRSKKHSGNESSNFLETAATHGNQRHNHRATVSSNSARRSNRGHRVNLNQSKLLRRVFTLAIYPSTRPRAISLSSSTASATSKTQKS